MFMNTHMRHKCTYHHSVLEFEISMHEALLMHAIQSNDNRLKNSCDVFLAHLFQSMHAVEQLAL